MLSQPALRNSPAPPRFTPRFAARAVGLALLLMLGPITGLRAEDPPPPPPNYPAAVGRLVVADAAPRSLAYSSAPGGPLFHLPTIVEALGVEMVVGPLGDSHRLLVHGEEILVGPGRAKMITRPAGTEGREEMVDLRLAPIRLDDGLRVPLDFLRAALGDSLALDFTWDSAAGTLRIGRRQTRVLEVRVDVIHQASSTVEIRFSEVPRFRVEKLPGMLEIYFQGDRLQALGDAPAPSPLVRGVDVETDRIRVRLADGAGTAEPRLLERPVPRLILEVFYQPTASENGAGANPRPMSVGGVRTIVLDPGHGGIETGAVGPGGTAEKELTLAIARALERQLARKLGVKVVLTRESDADLPLETRTAIANQNQADLFISLHFNSTFRGRAQGAETYFLSREASDQLAAEAAAAENAVGAGAEDPESDLQLILWDLAQTYHLGESQRFATLIQEELNQAMGLRDRGVKQAPFRVLMGASMPAVLVELGFLNHPEEEMRLRNPVYRGELVDALVRAVSRFKTQMERREAAADPEEMR